MDRSSARLPDFRVDGIFKFFVIAGSRGYACKDIRYEDLELVAVVPSMVTSKGWYSPDDELRFPKEAVQQILPGEWKYGDDVYELGNRVKLVTE